MEIKQEDDDATPGGFDSNLLNSTVDINSLASRLGSTSIDAIRPQLPLTTTDSMIANASNSQVTIDKQDFVDGLIIDGIHLRLNSGNELLETKMDVIGSGVSKDKDDDNIAVFGDNNSVTALADLTLAIGDVVALDDLSLEIGDNGLPGLDLLSGPEEVAPIINEVFTSKTENSVISSSDLNPNATIYVPSLPQRKRKSRRKRKLTKKEKHRLMNHQRPNMTNVKTTRQEAFHNNRKLRRSSRLADKARNAILQQQQAQTQQQQPQQSTHNYTQQQQPIAQIEIDDNDL